MSASDAKAAMTRDHCHVAEGPQAEIGRVRERQKIGASIQQLE
jgi:hypothetical protein